MAVTELLRTESDGSLSFGNHTLNEKAKVEDYKYEGDLMKVKTYKPMTKLERNGLFVYESVPGTSVYNYSENESGVTFKMPIIMGILVSKVKDPQVHCIAILLSCFGHVGPLRMAANANLHCFLAHADASALLHAEQ